MNPFRQIANDTASLLRDIRRGFQHLMWRLSWRSRKRQIEQEARAAEKENLRRGVRAASKMCPECRALIPAGSARCPECGAVTAHVRSGGFRRWLDQTLPFEMSVSMMLISACFALFVVGAIWSAGMPGPHGADPPGILGAIMSLNGRVLLAMGANVGSLAKGPQPWRMVTAIFLHAGLLHIAFNSLALRVIGPLVEEIYGASLMFVLFLFTGITGNVFSVWWHGPMLFQIGASGAIFGMIGVAAVYGYRRRDRVGRMLRGQMVQWAIYGVVMGVFFRADNVAHIGGFLAGAVAAAILPDPSKLILPLARKLWGALALVGVIVTIGSFVLIAAGVYIGP